MPGYATLAVFAVLDEELSAIDIQSPAEILSVVSLTAIRNSQPLAVPSLFVAVPLLKQRVLKRETIEL
jgi:hypothetical protein